MKKCFLAVATALSLAGYGFAQDDTYEEEVVYEEVEEGSAEEEVVYEEVEEGSAEEEVVYEEVKEPAPAPKKAKAPSTPNANGKLGIGAELTGLDAIRIVYNLDASLGFVGILSFDYYSSKAEVSQMGGTVSNDDGGVVFGIGAGFIYTMPTPVLPMFFEGDILFQTTPTDVIAGRYNGSSTFGLEAYLGAKATVVKSLELSGQIGLGFTYEWWEDGDVEFSAMNIGFKTKVYATWYFM